MTIKQKKEYLRRYKEAKSKIRALEETIREVNANALPGSMDYSKDKIQITPTNDKMDNHVIRLQELLDELVEARNEAVEICTDILKTISQASNDTYYTILHRRYILTQTWETIEEEMHYSQQRLFELLCEALMELDIKTE